MSYKLLFVNEFEKDLEQELLNAKKRIYIQFMTFEGDKAGQRLAKNIITSHQTNKTDTRILIDRYTDRYLSRKFYKDKEVREEHQATNKMLERMRESGIRVNRTRPYGFLRLLFMIRNHKKIIVIDDVCYLGGINISDHNYEWHDFMIKITDKQTTQAVAGDFLASWEGIDKPYHHHNVYTNKYLEYKYKEMIRNAQHEIIVSSPYVMDIALIRHFKHKPVRRVVLTSKEGNWGVLNYLSRYITRKLSDLGVEIYHYKRFSHAKFLCVDKQYLLIGSSNFGQENFSALDEIGLVINNKTFINEFLKKMHPQEQTHARYVPKKSSYFFSYLATLIAHYVLKGYIKFFKRWSKPLG
jgi:cardiolipin synthase A/B